MTSPRVSIGLAVYNGEEHLTLSIESILAQTYTDFELIISDNASTDATEKICRRFAELDERVLYSRNPVNIGGVRNENRTMSLARGEYFKLAAHDDLINPEYLERCVAELDRHLDADLCVPTARVIGASGEEIPIAAPVAGLEPRPADRIRAIADRRYTCEAMYGVIRTSAMRAVRPQANRIPSDYVVLCELALRSPFLHAPEAMIWRRVHAGNRFLDPRARMVWFEPDLLRTGEIRLPFWRHLSDMAVMLLRVDVGPRTWCRCWLEVGRVGFRYWRSLAKDVAVAAQLVVMGRSHRRARYRRAAGDASVEARSSRAVLVVTGDLSGDAHRALVRDVVDRLAGAGDMPTVLVGRSAAEPIVAFSNALRRDGVPVQVSRAPSGLERRAGSLGRFAVTVAAIVDSGADDVVVLPGGDSIVPHLTTAGLTLLRHVGIRRVAADDGSAGPPSTRRRAPIAAVRSVLRAARRRAHSFVDRAEVVAEPPSRRADDAAAYWGNPGEQGWQANSHWRGAAQFADEDRWRAIGLEHLAMLDELAPPDWPGRDGSFGRVVDWGVGGGANAVAFAPRASEIVGVDVSAESLAEAGRQLAASGTPYLPVLTSVADTGAAVAAIGPTCDLFLCLYVLELVPSADHGLAILDAARDVLRPGGIGLIQAKYRTKDRGTRSRGRRYDRNLANMTTFDVDELWGAFAERGLRPHAVRLVPQNDLDERYAYFVVVREP